MNQQQKKYAIERVIGIESKKITHLRSEVSTGGITLTGLQKFHLLKDGEIQLKQISDINQYSMNYVNEIYDFSAYEKDPSFDQEKFTESAAKITYESKRIQDEIMLGDAEEAIALIQRFEDMEA